MASELKPCPFCGSADDVQLSRHSHEGAAWMTCVECDTDGPIAKTVAAAIAAWNTRTPSRAAIRAEVLRELADEWEREFGTTALVVRLRDRADKAESDDGR